MIKMIKEEKNYLALKATGKLEKADYEEFCARVEQLIQQRGKLRILLEMEDFHGWTAGALWEDVKFDMKHFNDIERLALVGDSKWEKGMAAFCKPFTTAKVRYFPRAEIEEAKRWLETG